MCDSYATTDEHVPPKCLFPEKKDLPLRVSLREELIKVPSCKAHNTAKSRDDEYLLYVLCMNIANNSIAFRQFATKIMRAYKRRPALMKSIVTDSKKVVAVDSNGTAMNTLMLKADMKRIHKCFNQMARALYYHEFRKPFIGQCRFVHDFTIRDESKFKVVVSTGENEHSAIEHVKAYFKDLDHKGENASVFRYRFEEPDDQGLIAVSMQFYGGSNVFIVFLPIGENSGDNSSTLQGSVRGA
jgi:hypothetical protein